MHLIRYFALLLLLVCDPARAGETVSCAYPNKDSRELKPAETCGSVSADGRLRLDASITDNIDWNKYGLECIYVYGTEDQDGWYFINQAGAGRISPFLQDNDCAPFTAGVAAGLSHGKVVFYNQALEIVKRTDYVWASGYRQGVAKVCRGELVKAYDAGGEHYEYQGGHCGYIDTNFEVVVPVEYPYESTPEPDGL